MRKIVKSECESETAYNYIAEFEIGGITLGYTPNYEFNIDELPPQCAEIYKGYERERVK